MRQRNHTTALLLFCSIAVSQAFAGGPQPPVAFTTQQHQRSSTVLQLSSGGASSSSASAVLPPVPVDLKAPPALYQGAVAAGAAKAAAPAAKIFQLGIVAGAHIAIGAYLAVSVGGACPGLATTNPGLQKLIFGAIGLPTGLIMTLVTGAELFTGNTALVTGAYMEGKITKRQLAKNWVCSYAGNFVGSLLLAWLAHKAGTLGTSAAAVNIATAKCSVAFDVAFYRYVSVVIAAASVIPSCDGERAPIRPISYTIPFCRILSYIPQWYSLQLARLYGRIHGFGLLHHDWENE